MELAFGSVEEAILRDAWEPEHMLLTFRAMCRAVQRIHCLEIVHRDLKPGNFLVKGDGSVCLSDFGTARKLNETERPLSAVYSWPVGDMRYSAPEVLVGLHDVDPQIQYRADIYALGAILFELFAGVPLSQVAMNPATMNDLRAHIQAIPAKDRLRIYQGILGSLAAANALPSVAAGGASVPPVLRVHIDRLYRGLAAWDFRRRPYADISHLGQLGRNASWGIGPLSPHEWNAIFAAINGCILVYRNDQRQSAWAASKDRRRQACSNRHGGDQ